jgi:hypothetical protein
MNNKVEEFFENNKGVYYSLRSVAKKTGMKKRTVHAICANSDNIKKLKNNEFVGCGKHNLNIFFS